jgi:hypothetical protein
LNRSQTDNSRTSASRIATIGVSMNSRPNRQESDLAHLGQAADPVGAARDYSDEDQDFQQ